MNIPLVLLSVLIACTYAAYVPVYVMLPLETIKSDGTFNTALPWDSWFTSLKSAGVDGLMGDVWWGIVEGETPKQYNWQAYSQLMSYVSKYGFKFQATISFHECGGNVGDACNVLLPSWVRSVGNSNPDIYYTDRNGDRDMEYLSLGVDTLSLFEGRSPVQIYSDFVESFVTEFSSLLGSTIVELQISLGPAGELRYPSYQLSRWQFPGAGEFQCYDKYMLANLSASAAAAGHPEWGHGGPSNAGSYNCNPCQDYTQCPFFGSGFDNYNTPYGQFFLNWYTSQLVAHGDRVLSAVSNVVKGLPIHLAAKISGIHWQHQTNSHSAELTAGYKNTDGQGYQPFAALFAKHNVTFDFTCFEMSDSSQPNTACSGPEELIYDTMKAAQAYGLRYEGENALNCYDSGCFGNILYESKRMGPIDTFTYLRLGQDLFNNNNLATFTYFVHNMHNL